MENASKALIIAGAVLIGILIISMGVLLATTLQKTAKTKNRLMKSGKPQINFQNQQQTLTHLL